jgi:hypothetical protein
VLKERLERLQLIELFEGPEESFGVIKYFIRHYKREVIGLGDPLHL